MDFEQLRTFLEVARHKSFSRAGEKLSLTQPAISAQIRSLETEIGAQLFDRSRRQSDFYGRRPRLRTLRPKHCLECQQHILLAVGEMQRSPRGEVSISANESTCLYVLPQVFTQFKQQYSRVGLNIIRADRSRTLEAVQNREVDFGVIALPIKDVRLNAEWIHKDELVLAAAPNHALAKAGGKLRMEDCGASSAAAAETGPPAGTDRLALQHSRTEAEHRHGTRFERTAEAFCRSGHGDRLRAPIQRRCRRTSRQL